MIHTQQEDAITGEVFPIALVALPSLTAYILIVRNGDHTTVGGKFSYRCRKNFPGHWVWTEHEHRLLTDQLQTEQALQALIETLWGEEAETFQTLRTIQQDSFWKPTAQGLADFVARGLVLDRQAAINDALKSYTKRLGNIQIERAVDIRGWVVEGKPAISVSITSHLLSKQDLKSYTAQLLKQGESTDALVGIMVQEKYLKMKGEVTGIAGPLREHRAVLLKIAKEASSRELLQRAPDDELVVQVSVVKQRRPYDVIMSALDIIVRTIDYTRFEINGSEALKVLRLSPFQRSSIIRRIIAAINTPQPLVQRPYTSTTHTQSFLRAADVQFEPLVRIGKGISVASSKLLPQLYTHGIYERLERFISPGGLKVGVVCHTSLATEAWKRFIPELSETLGKLSVSYQSIDPIRVPETTRIVLEKVIRWYREEQKADLILGIFPDEVKHASHDIATWGVYQHFKSLTVGLGMPSQIVQRSTMQRVIDDPQKAGHILGNIVLGILSKVGNIPYILAKPLPYADIVVGIDIARRAKTRLVGSINATALARIYQNTGAFLQYAIYDAPLEGETIPEHVLHALFPPHIFEGKSILIHRDGIFRGNEKQALKAWAQALHAEIALVEILKTGTPRLYGNGTNGVQIPRKGDALKLSTTEAFLVSTPPPFENATPLPLHIRTEPPFPIENAIHSVLTLTLLHYGSLRQPRLPVTLHYSDEIASLALDGIKPKDLEGTLPFWL